MSAEFLTAIAGVLLSLAFSYVPKLNEKFAALESTYKRLIMLGLLVVVSAGLYGLACAGWAADLGIEVTCDRPGLISLLQAFVWAMIANQAAYQISPEPSAVRKAKLARG